jgi:hypothetical protein
VRPSLRFLVLAALGWAGFRAASLGALPGRELLRIDRSEAKPPPIVSTEFPPITPIEPAQAAIELAEPIAIRPVTIPVYYMPIPATASTTAVPHGPARLTNILTEPSLNDFGPSAMLDQWPLPRIVTASVPMRSSVVVAGQSVPAAFRRSPLDRVQLTAWGFLRSSREVPGPNSLASGGTLGGSQAGARLNYNLTRRIAATLRTSSDVGRRGGEVAAGVRIQPVGGMPLWLTAERRQRLGPFGGGRNAFALFLEGGVYDRPLPWRFSLDTYLQGGVVGFHRRDRVIDGGFTVPRPIFRQFSAGLGLWGGAQPGLYRVDAGPRVSMRVRNNVRVHLDWRQRLAGNAQPGSGPALTLAGDF